MACNDSDSKSDISVNMTEKVPKKITRRLRTLAEKQKILQHLRTQANGVHKTTLNFFKSDGLTDSTLKKIILADKRGGLREDARLQNRGKSICEDMENEALQYLISRRRREPSKIIRWSDIRDAVAVLVAKKHRVDEHIECCYPTIGDKMAAKLYHKAELHYQKRTFSSSSQAKKLRMATVRTKTSYNLCVDMPKDNSESEVNNSSNNYGQLLHAVNFASHKHRLQMRKDGETPYINHPIGVAYILANEGGISDLATLQAALLHDTVEDTDTSLAELEFEFSQHVRELVEECSDDKTLPKAERKRLQIAHAPHASHEAKLIKLADKLYNLRDILQKPPVGDDENDDDGTEKKTPWSDARCQEYFEWSAKVVRAMGRNTNEKLEQALAQVLAKRNVRLFNGDVVNITTKKRIRKKKSFVETTFTLKEEPL